MFFRGFRFNRFKGFRIAYNIGHLATFALGFLTVAATHDAAAGNASVGAKAVLALAISIQNIKLGYPKTAIANVYGASNDFAIGILSLKVWWAATASSAGLVLFVSSDDVLVSIFFGKSLGEDAFLTSEPALLMRITMSGDTRE